MVKLELTAILYSKKNYDLAYRLRSLCKKFCINVVNVLDFVELTIKSIELCPQLLLCDCETVEFTSSNLNAFMEKNEFKNTKIIFLGNLSQTLPLKNFVGKNLRIASFDKLFA